MLCTIKITSAMFPELYGAILGEWNPSLSREQWQQAFVNRWGCDEDHFGYALTDDGRIVGMLGTLFSRRPVAGREQRFCNLHSWHVRPEYRASSLALMKPVLDLKDHTLTDFTASAAVIAIAKRLGFKSLNSSVFVLPPIPAKARSPKAVIREMVGPEDAEAAHLDAADRQIYQDHQDVDCGHMVARVGESSCYVVYSRIAQHRLPYCLVHYINNKTLFVDQQAAIRAHLLHHSRSQFAVVDARLLDGFHLPLTFRASSREQLYRTTDVAANEIDTLYSEIVLFKHSPLPTLRQRLSTTVKRYIAPAVRRYVGINLSL
ncbi:MAG: hypothetical protein WD738_03870 [Pirellulales bacterium]